MHRFIGRFEYSIDTKGRVNIPARFRKGLDSSANDTFVVSKAPDHRLRVYPSDVWYEKEQFYAKLPSNPANTRFLRALYESIEEVELDGQGRIKLPVHLRDYANISNKVALIGFSSEQCIEICTPQSLQEPSEDDFNTMYYTTTGVGASNE